MKCKIGQKKVKGRCVRRFKPMGKSSWEISILKATLITSIIGIGGWAVFIGIVEIFNFDKIPSWVKIIIGLIIIMIAYRVGFMKKGGIPNA